MAAKRPGPGSARRYNVNVVPTGIKIADKQVSFAMPVPFVPLLCLAAVIPGAVEGTVTNSVTGAPVRKALVTLLEIDEYAAYQALSDAGGRFRIDNVKPGDYVLWGEAQGFVREPPDYSRVAPRSRMLTVAAGKPVKDAVVPLIPSAVISGRVLDESEEPVPGATVRLYRYAYTRNGVRMERVREATADDRGEYRIFDVAPGRWYLGVNKYVAPPEPAGRVHSSGRRWCWRPRARCAGGPTGSAWRPRREEAASSYAISRPARTNCLRGKMPNPERPPTRTSAARTRSRRLRCRFPRGDARPWR